MLPCQQRDVWQNGSDPGSKSSRRKSRPGRLRFNFDSLPLKGDAGLLPMSTEEARPETHGYEERVRRYVVFIAEPNIWQDKRKTARSSG